MKVLWQAISANALSVWAMASLLTIGVLLGLVLARMVAQRILKALDDEERAAPLHHVLAAMLGATRLWLLFPIALYCGTSALELPAKLDASVDKLVVVALLLQAALWLNALIGYWLTGAIEKRRGTDGGAVTALALVHFAARVVVWTMALLVVLNHLGFNVSALVTGLGVGGVAVALAVQNILGDLFASLSIVLDKPFVIGDFIVVGDSTGRVEHIGLKTTRVRALGGELIVFSNADLLKSRIHNFKLMPERRMAFKVMVDYVTPTDKLAAIPAMLKEMVLEHGDAVRFDHAHFMEVGEAALTFEAVYFVLNPEKNNHLDIQQAINLKLLRRFDQQDIEIVHSTRIVPWREGPTPAAGAPGRPVESRPKGEQNRTADAIA
jgi:small-conductance mechanosensitive channel